MRKNILITGVPRSGKSTFLEKLVLDCPQRVGFFTKEIREDNLRTSFEAVFSNGENIIFADIDHADAHKVGKFFVHIGELDPILKRLAPGNSKNLLYIDEIGQMQLFSDLFRKMVLHFFNSLNTCVTTITSVYEDDFTRNLKNRADVIFVDINARNREERLIFVRALLKKIEKARRYVAEPGRFIFRGNIYASLQSEHGVRKLVYKKGLWNCECDFFNLYGLCSHTIAIETIKDVQ